MEWQSTTWDGTLSIGGVSMHCPAWVVFDVYTLWDSPIFRGDSLMIPFRPGRIGLPRRDDETTWSLPMMIAGDVDQLGAPYGSFRAGYLTNLSYLQANVRSVSGGLLRPVSLTLPGGGARTGDAAVQIRVGEQTMDGWLASLELTIPDGSLA